MDDSCSINGWAARDESNSLYAYFDDKPVKGDSMWANESNKFYKLPREILKSIKWTDEEPTQIEMTIKKYNT